MFFLQSLDNKIHETVETINSLKTSREFFLSYAKDPQLFIDKWLKSQSRDLKTMTDVTGNPEEERRVEYYYQPWVNESVCRYCRGGEPSPTVLLTNTVILRYFYGKIQQKRAELDSSFGVRNG